MPTIALLTANQFYSSSPSNIFGQSIYACDVFFVFSSEQATAFNRSTTRLVSHLSRFRYLLFYFI